MIKNDLELRDPCTILMPLYNGSEFIRKSIANLCEIAGPQDEILIIDDGSTDISRIELMNYLNYDSRIVLHVREHLGLVETLNFGLRNAKHELIARADVDDIYDSRRISLQVKYLSTHPDTVAVFSDYRILSSDGVNLGLFPSAVFPELTAFSLVSSQRTPHPSVMYRKSIVLECGGYFQEDFPAEDLALWIRLVEKGQIAAIPEMLLNYTVHNASVTKTKQVLMRVKSLELRQRFALKSETILLIENIRKQLSQYEIYSHRNLRVLFLIQDLINFNRLTSGFYRRRIYSIIIAQLLLRNIFLIAPFWQVYFMKAKRLRIK